MLVRALIVVLLVLNLGVAAWWLFKPATPAYQTPVSDAGGVALKLIEVKSAEPGTSNTAADPCVSDADQADGAGGANTTACPSP